MPTIPADILAAADREKALADDTLNAAIRDAARYLDEDPDPVKAWARVAYSLRQAGAPHPADGIMATAAVRFAQIERGETPDQSIDTP